MHQKSQEAHFSSKVWPECNGVACKSNIRQENGLTFSDFMPADFYPGDAPHNSGDEVELISD